MIKKTSPLLTLAVAALPLSAFAVDMHGGLSLEPAQAMAHPPGEASISILPSAMAPAQSIMLAPQLAVAQAAAPRSAAKADVQAMIAPKEPVVPAGEDIPKMSGDAASGAGEAIMDRILYIKGTPASGAVAAVPGLRSAAPSQLKPARRGPLGYLLSAPIKAVQASTDYVSKKTKASPFWTSFAFSAANLAGALKLMVLDGYMRTSAEMSGGRLAAVLGLSLMALLYLGYGMAIDKANAEKETVRKMNEAVAKNEAALKAHPGVLSVYGETVPGQKKNDHVIIVKVSALTAKNITRIPFDIDGFLVKVQFDR